MVSKSVLLISFTGRKSGKTYTTPVSYSQEGDQVFIFTHAGWWKNLLAGTPPAPRSACAFGARNARDWPNRLPSDQQAIEAGLAAHLRKVPSDARWYGVSFDENGNPGADEIEKAVQTVVMVRVSLC